MIPTERVLDGRTLGRLDRWRNARALFVRPDGAEAERAVALAFGRRWSRAPVYGRARRLLLESNAETFLDGLQDRLGPLADRVRVAPEDPQQTKWDAMSHLTPLSSAKSEVRALWFADLLRGGGDFFTKFQPIADLATGEVIGYEGLLRAKADSESRPSAEMFPAARALSIERPFEKLSWLCVLDSTDRLPPGARLFLNANPRLLVEEAEELELLWRGLGKCGLDPSRVVLDLVEAETVESLESLSRALEPARSRGVAVALDDVTSPYKAIQYCEAFRPDWVKIDCALTRGIARDARRRSILKFFGRLARSFSFGLIAEGIETAADLDACVASGVAAAQGYFVGRPALEPAPPQAPFREWVARRRAAGPPPVEVEENGNGSESVERAS